MTVWTVIVCLAAGLFGAGCYRAGRRAAENEAYRNREKDNAKVDEIIRSVSAVRRRELLQRLRGGGKE